MIFAKYTGGSAAAAYFLFIDEAKVRHLMLSYPILDTFLVWKEHSSCNTEIELALERLEGARNPNEAFPLSLEEIIAKYGAQIDPESEKDKRWRGREIRLRQSDLLASLLRYLVMRMGYLLDRTAAERDTEQARANASFEASLGLKIPPSHDIAQVDKPVWGPIECFNEGPLEPFNRAYLLLSCLMRVVHDNYAWKCQFVWSKAPFGAQIIPLDVIPMWMWQVAGQNERTPTTYRSVSVENLPHGLKLRLSKTATIHTERMRYHNETFLASEGLSLPYADQLEQCLSDPRGFETRESFLDSVRAQLNFVALRVQFFSVSLLIRIEGEDDDELPLYGPDENERWRDIQTEFGKHPNSSILEYTLRPLLGTNVNPMESSSYTLPPASHIGVGPDGNPQTLNWDVYRASQRSYGESGPESSKQEHSETEKRVAKFLADLGTLSNLRIVRKPVDIFGKIGQALEQPNGDCEIPVSAEGQAVHETFPLDVVMSDGDEDADSTKQEPEESHESLVRQAFQDMEISDGAEDVQGVYEALGQAQDQHMCITDHKGDAKTIHGEPFELQNQDVYMSDE